MFKRRADRPTVGPGCTASSTICASSSSGDYLAWSTRFHRWGAATTSIEGSGLINSQGVESPKGYPLDRSSPGGFCPTDVKTNDWTIKIGVLYSGFEPKCIRPPDRMCECDKVSVTADANELAQSSWTPASIVGFWKRLPHTPEDVVKHGSRPVYAPWDGSTDSYESTGRLFFWPNHMRWYFNDQVSAPPSFHIISLRRPLFPSESPSFPSEPPPLGLSGRHGGKLLGVHALAQRGLPHPGIPYD